MTTVKDKRLRLGVVGAGSWAVGNLLPELMKRRDEVRFRGVSRLGVNALERVRETFDFEMASTRYADVIDAGLDICIVASPTGLHFEQAQAALLGGAHVLLEKPMTIDPGEAWELVRLAERLDRHLLISYGWNYRPMTRAAKRMFDEGGIGTLEQLTMSMSSTTRELFFKTGAYPDADADTQPDVETWTDPALSGGGYAQAQLTHALGLALWLTGLRGNAAFALMGTPVPSPIEFHDAIALQFNGGAVGSLAGASSHLNANNNKIALEVRAVGRNGQFHLDMERECVWMFRAPDQDLRYFPTPNEGAYICDGPPNVLVDLALGRDVENCSPGELGARVVEILDACYRSHRSGRLEHVTPGMNASEPTADTTS